MAPFSVRGAARRTQRSLRQPLRSHGHARLASSRPTSHPQQPRSIHRRQRRQSNHSLRTVRMRLNLMGTKLTCSDQPRQRTPRGHGVTKSYCLLAQRVLPTATRLHFPDRRVEPTSGLPTIRPERPFLFARALGGIYHPRMRQVRPCLARLAYSYAPDVQTGDSGTRT